MLFQQVADRSDRPRAVIRTTDWFWATERSPVWHEYEAWVQEGNTPDPPDMSLPFNHPLVEEPDTDDDLREHA